MNDQSNIPVTLEEIPFADLHISDLNPRKVVNDASIITLAENIRAYGLIQNLAGFRDEVGVGVVVGGRRYRALALLQDDTRFHIVNVKMAPDQATAEYWATSENAQCEALHPADEIQDFGAMEKRGATVADIATAYGATEAHVYRRLALAALPCPVIDALRSGEISLSNAAAFTISDDEKLTLEVLENVRGQGESDHRIKKMLKPDAVKDSDRRAVYVGVEAYIEAGGRTGSDLFADEVLIEDPAILDELFGKKLAEGDVLDGDGQARLAALQSILDGSFTDEQKAHAGVLVYVDSRGVVQFETGLIRGADKNAAIDAGVLAKSNHAGSSGTKSPISNKLRIDLERIATGARKHAALRDPDLLLALLAFQLSGKSGYTNVLGLRETEVPNIPTTEMAGYTLDERLTKTTRPAKFSTDMGRVFRAYKAKGPAFVMEEITRHLAALLTVDEDLGDVIDKVVETDIRENFTPTAANFFSRVGARYLVKLWRELLDLTEDHPIATTFGKLKKSEKAEKMEAMFCDPEMRKAHSISEGMA